MSALILGTALALVAVAYVLVPLFRDAAIGPVTADRRPATGSGDRHPTTAVAALREIEFDRATGKLSEADYQTLKARYTGEALATMRETQNVRPARAASGPDDPAIVPATSASPGDLAEEMISRYRRGAPECPACGPPLELDAVYCSACGLYLEGTCRACGRAVTEPAARYCSACGRALAA